MTDLEKTNLLFFASEANENEVKKTQKPQFLPASLARKLAVEAFGTYALTYVVALGESGFIAGLILIALVYAFGHISGGHFNPAVSFASYIRGTCDMKTAAAYSLSQLTGAFVASGQRKFVLQDSKKISLEKVIPSVMDDVSVGSAFISELTMTLIFVSVILNVATTRAQAKNSFFGIAIGFSLAAAATAAGMSGSGGCLNPAIGIALPVVIAEKTEDIWIYILAPLLGGALAAGLFRLTADPSEFK